MDIATLSIVKDPRSTKNRRYSIESLLLIIFSSVVSGYDTIDEMISFSELKIDWLRKYVKLERIPCRETLRFFLCCLKPEELITIFEEFIASQNLKHDKDIISVDGKTMRGTHRANGGALHIISAWSSDHGLTLAQLESEGKKNEIKTIPKLIDRLKVEKAVITTDAMGCQKNIADAVKKSKNDYVLQVKGNQKQLREDIESFYEYGQNSKKFTLKSESFEQTNKGHGRIELRRYVQFELDKKLITNRQDWSGLKTAIRVERTRIIKEKETTEVSWYISSLNLEVELAAKAVRSHWRVENNLHWWLDVVFKEDDYQLYSGHGPLNMAVLKRFCRNMLERVPGKSPKHKVIGCAIDDSIRERALFG